MTDITCHIKDCLHNKRNKCTANAIVLGSKGNCKAKAFAKDMMKHSRKQHWRCIVLYRFVLSTLFQSSTYTSYLNQGPIV